MPKKKKEAEVFNAEDSNDSKAAVINYGNVSIELHYDRKLGRCYGVILDDGVVKRFDAKVK